MSAIHRAVSNAKTAQLNLRLRPTDLADIKAEAAKAETPTGPWCEQIILDAIHERRLPRKKVEKPEFEVDPRLCPHDRLPEPGFGLGDSQCPDCGTQIRKVGRHLPAPTSTR